MDQVAPSKANKDSLKSIVANNRTVICGTSFISKENQFNIFPKMRKSPEANK
jgi:hypothetical protein